MNSFSKLSAIKLSLPFFVHGPARRKTNRIEAARGILESGYLLWEEDSVIEAIIPILCKILLFVEGFREKLRPNENAQFAARERWRKF